MKSTENLSQFPSPLNMAKSQAKILVVEDWEAQLEGLITALEGLGYEVDGVRNAEEALQKAQSGEYSVMLLDLEIYETIQNMNRIFLTPAGPRTGLNLIPKVTRTPAIDMEILVLTQFGDIDSKPEVREYIVEAVRAGARGYFPKSLVMRSPQTPSDGAVLPEGRLLLQTQIESLLALYQQKKERRKGYAFSDVVCRSPYMVWTVDTLKQIAQQNTPIVLWGERGVGKSFLAEVVHFNSHFFRQDAAWIRSVADLAMYEANPAKLHGTTLILHYIEDFALDAQQRLLSLLQSVSGQSRLIMICTEDPTALRNADKLDPNLYDLINNGHSFEIPPLRDGRRLEDIVALAAHFVEEANKRWGAPISPTFSQPVQEALGNYRWEGNIPQLRRIIEDAVIRARWMNRTALEIVQYNDFRGIIPDVEVNVPQKSVKIRGCPLPVDSATFKLMELLAMRHPAAATRDDLQKAKLFGEEKTLVNKLRNEIQNIIKEPTINRYHRGFINLGKYNPQTERAQYKYGYKLYEMYQSEKLKVVVIE